MHCRHKAQELSDGQKKASCLGGSMLEELHGSEFPRPGSHESTDPALPKCKYAYKAPKSIFSDVRDKKNGESVIW